ncbi:MAG: hypothetical protein KGP29_04905 [Proteobacteria bacterium]|nr:hypothetical protein [Pseudomonadota bacterium]
MQTIIPAISTSFYSDWTFWSVVFSAIAILLSQLPPIRIWFKRARIEFELHSKICLTHKVGNPNLQLHIMISNVGGRKIKIRKINAKIESDNEVQINLPTQNYLQTPSDKNGILFTTFSIKPGEDWGHIINLLNFFNRENNRIYLDLRRNLLNDLRIKLDSRSSKEKAAQKIVEADENYTVPLRNFFDQHFVWNSGEYKLTVEILTDKDSANYSKSFRFTIFESHVDELKSIVDRYKYGEDILYDVSFINLPQIILDVTEV